MAISIPIISEFDGKGIAKAKQEFSQLEGVGEKAQFALKKAAIPAAAAVAGIGAALFDATKGAMEDAAAQKMLEKQLKNSAGATDKMVAAVEESIGAMSTQLGIADDELRPAFANLTRATKDVTRSQELMALATDIAASTGKSLESVSVALAKAENGQYAALKKLGIPMGENIRALMDQAAETKKVAKAQADYDALVAGGASAKDQAKAFEKLTDAQAKLNAVTVEGADYVKDLNEAFGGAAAAAADTAQGKFKRLQITLAETKESIGAALLPAVEAVLPVLLKFGEWAQKNPQTFLVVAGAIGAIATAITAINIAMALNPFGLIAIGLAAVGAASVIAFQRFEKFRASVEFVTNQFIRNINALIRTVNLLPGVDIKTIQHADFSMVTPQPVGADISRFQGMSASPAASAQSVTINVNGGDPQAVVGALRRYMQTNGSVPIRVTG